MKRLLVFPVLMILFLLFTFTGSVIAAAALSRAIAPVAMVKLTGGTGGQPVANLAVQDQSGSADTPSKYVTFTTPGTIYKGYSRFTLPASIATGSITDIKVKINYKGLPKTSQRWSWSLYDWTASKWVYIGDNTGAKNNTWFAATFSTTLPKRFISAGREMRLLLQSNNATGNAKLDFESIGVTYTVSSTPTASATVSRTPTVSQTPTVTPTPTATLASGTSLSIYDDALLNGWGDWSWGGATYNFNSVSPVHGGTKAIAVTYVGPADWSGLQFGRNDLFPLGAYDTLRFWVHGGASGGQIVQVQVSDGATTLKKDITPTAGIWKMVDMPLSGLSQVKLLVWFNTNGDAQPTFYIDDVAFVASGAPTPTPTATTPPSSGPALTVDVGAGRHAISPYIYGMNFTDETLAADLNLPVRRWGGNSTTRYNWQTNMQNLANDWYFENVLADVSADDFVAQNNRTNTDTLMTVPLIGWTPKTGSPTDHPYACGFRDNNAHNKYGGAQDGYDDPWDTNCGNGLIGNVNITGNDPTDTSMAITPTWVSDWVNHFKTTYGAAGSGGVKFYNLDNEPGIWNSTHHDVHPNPLTYDEIRDRTYAYAAAIKAADSTALTLGPVEDGWCRYFFSAADNCDPNGADRNAPGHDNMDYVAWYLAQMKLYEQNNGVRILDYFDLHIYPQANGVYADGTQDTDAIRALRLRSTRQLWDPTYVDESWIADMNWQGDTVQLIPRMHNWVNSNYPGTKLAVSEYSWGAMGYLNGALAQADVLGIFGREGLDLATLWGPPTATQPGAYAFRIYRNYDGLHHGFGDTGVHAASADQDQLAVYAAQRTSDSALTLVVINKTGGALTSNLSLAGFTPSGNAKVYRYSAADLNAIQNLADQVVSAGGFSATYPANSITLLVVPGSAP